MEFEKPAKYGKLVVKNGSYTNKDGEEKNRYHEIGVVFATSDMSRISVKFHNTQNGEGQWGYIFEEKPKEQSQSLDDEIKDIFGA